LAVVDAYLSLENKRIAAEFSYDAEVVGSYCYYQNKKITAEFARDMAAVNAYLKS